MTTIENQIQQKNPEYITKIHASSPHEVEQDTNTTMIKHQRCLITYIITRTLIHSLTMAHESG